MTNLEATIQTETLARHEWAPDPANVLTDTDLGESSSLEVGTLRTVVVGQQQVTFRRIFAHPHWGWEIVSVYNLC